MALRYWTQIIIVAIAALGATTAHGQTKDFDARRLYGVTRTCFVAIGRFHSAFLRAGDTANAQLFEAKAKEAHDLAYHFGRMLHLSDAQVSRDLDATADAELPRLVADNQYLTKVATACKRQGLM